MGDNPLYFAVGGINARASFGLGVWNLMVWGIDELGVKLLTANYNTASSSTWAAMAAVG